MMNAVKGTVNVSIPLLDTSSTNGQINAKTMENNKLQYHAIGHNISNPTNVDAKVATTFAIVPSIDLLPSTNFRFHLCLPKGMPTKAAAPSPGPHAKIAIIGRYSACTSQPRIDKTI